MKYNCLAEDEIMKKITMAFILTILIMLTGCASGHSDDWLSAQGQKITNKGSVRSFTTSYYYQDRDDESKSHTIGEMDIPVKVTIEETQKDCEDGRKKVILTTRLDYSEWDDLQPVGFIGAFDRYTGTEFYSPDNKKNTHSLTITTEDKTYDIIAKIGGKIDREKKLYFRTLTVDCPKDYDGTVFEIGYGSIEMLNEYENSDITKRIHRIDETPFFPTNGYPYYFVSYNNK